MELHPLDESFHEVTSQNEETNVCDSCGNLVLISGNDFYLHEQGMLYFMLFECYIIKSCYKYHVLLCKRLSVDM